MLKQTFTLHEYQKAFINNIRRSLVVDKKIIACAATGSGKSKVFCTIASNAIDRGRTALIISESTRIFEQIREEIEAEYIQAGYDEDFIPPGRVYLAMAQTLARRPYLIEQFAAMGDRLVVMNDECHIGTATKIILSLPFALLIGFSATPSAKEAPHLVELYKNIVVGPQPHELVVGGYLAPYKHFARHPADLSKLQLQYGEFTEKSQQEVFDTRRVYDGLIQDLRTQSYHKCLIFTSSIEHCERLTAELLTHGFFAVQVHSGLDESTYNYNLGQFTKRLTPICVSVGILTKGFDFPEIDLIALQRATTSLPLYLQMIGRGSRIFPGKTHFTVLDYGENYRRHNLWDYEHDWATLWCEKKRTKKLGAAPVKSCPNCDYICAASATICPSCGHQFQKTKQQIDDDKKQTVLTEITKLYNEKMVGRKVSDLNAGELAIYSRLKNNKAHAIRVARAKGQSDPKFMQEYCDAMGYRPAWVEHQLRLLGSEKLLFRDFVLK